MRHCLVIKDNKGKIHYVVLLLFLIIIAILFSMIIEKRVLISMRDRVDNELVVTTFSGGVFDLERLYATVRFPKIIVGRQITYDFDKIYHDLNVYIDHKKAYDTVENILARNMVGSDVGRGIFSNIGIDTLIVYNVYNKIEIHKYDALGYTFCETDNKDEIITPNGIVVNKTSIYVKIGFELKGFLGIKRNHYLEKYISLEY